MQSLSIHLRPLSAFGTSLMGDTLFGHLCWAIRNRQGEDRLKDLLQGYTDNRPFAVVSDAFPSGFIPRPVLPYDVFNFDTNLDPKKAKNLKWVPLSAVNQPVQKWLDQAKSTEQVFPVKHRQQPHNSINRKTGSTGEDGFAPYSMMQEWFPLKMDLDCHIVIDEERYLQRELQECLEDIGAIGYGRDASIGLGKFEIQQITPSILPAQPQANACMTLAPCAPQGLGFEPNQSFYSLFTRFGKHGDMAVHQQGKPFKNPVLMAGAGSVFKSPPPSCGYIGQGLGGNGQLSKTIPDTVQQGYSPIIPVVLPQIRENIV